MSLGLFLCCVGQFSDSGADHAAQIVFLHFFVEKAFDRLEHLPSCARWTRWPGSASRWTCPPSSCKPCRGWTCRWTLCASRRGEGAPTRTQTTFAVSRACKACVRRCRTLLRSWSILQFHYCPSWCRLCLVTPKAISRAESIVLWYRLLPILLMSPLVARHFFCRLMKFRLA
jgi:hypothetical protein